MNQADLIPAREYSYTAACEGTLVKEGNQPVCVRAEASVNIFFGDGKTEAWKEIRGSFNGTEGTGTGTDSSRNSIIADAGSEVTYTLNIRNQVEKGIENLVIVDRLPALKDNGLVNNMQRNSGFKVSFPDSNPIRKASGQMVRLKDGDYNVTFAKAPHCLQDIGNRTARPIGSPPPQAETPSERIASEGIRTGSTR